MTGYSQMVDVSQGVLSSAQNIDERESWRCAQEVAQEKGEKIPQIA